MNFHDGRHSEAAGLLQHGVQPLAFETRHDQKNRIGPRAEALLHLPFVNDEILSKNRKTAGCSRLREMLESAQEKLFFREHRKGSSSRCLIASRKLRGIEVSPQQPRRGRSAFYLGYEAWAGPGPQAAFEIANNRVCAARQRPAFSRGQLFSLRSQDSIEHFGHVREEPRVRD
jgi:hypothetical protein